MVQPNRLQIKLPDQLQIDKLIVDVVHKMKNNLGGITGFAALLERDLGEDTPEGKLVEQIKTSALRLDDLVLDLMTLIRTMHISMEKLHVLPVLQQKIYTYEDEYERKCEIRNVTGLSDKDVRILSDSIYLDRLFKSLMTVIVKLNAHLKSVEICSEGDNRIVLKFCLHNLDIELDKKKNLTDIINKYEPVEARLAFHTVLRLAELLDCEISADALSHNQLQFNLAFKQEKIS